MFKQVIQQGQRQRERHGVTSRTLGPPMANRENSSRFVNPKVEKPAGRPCEKAQGRSVEHSLMWEANDFRTTSGIGPFPGWSGTACLPHGPNCHGGPG